MNPWLQAVDWDAAIVAVLVWGAILIVLAWFVASAATVGGGLGTGLESDEAIRAAAYSKREEERRNRLANKQA